MTTSSRVGRTRSASACRSSATRSRARPASTSTRRSPTATSSARAISRSRSSRRPGTAATTSRCWWTARDCLTADCLFKGTVGGTVGGGPTGYADQIHSIMERLMSLPPETRDPSRPPRALDDRRRVGVEPVHPRLARPRPRRAPSRAACAARMRPSSSGAPTTTARTRRGCATRTAATRSSAARRSSVSEGAALSERPARLDPGPLSVTLSHPTALRQADAAPPR